MKFDIEKFKVKKPMDFRVDLSDNEDVERILRLHGGQTIAEKKYDGYGIIIDNRFGKDNLKLYSLSKNPWSHESIPEISDDLFNLRKGLYVGEIVGKPNKVNFTKDDEFLAVKLRNFEHPNKKTLELAYTNPLEIKVYDILELDNIIIADYPLKDIKNILDDVLRTENISHVQYDFHDDADILRQNALDDIARGSEGFVVKNPDSSYSEIGKYVVGKRTNDWIKIKSKVTFDCAVLGLYQTQARLSQDWSCSNVLLGVYNEKTNMFETISKLNVTSKELSHDLFSKLHDKCSYTFSSKNPYNWQNTGVPLKKSDHVVYSPQLLKGTLNEKIPFMYVKNPLNDSIVIEVSAMQITKPKDSWHSCGIYSGQVHSLRQPVFVREREKKPIEATTTEQIKSYLSE